MSACPSIFCTALRSAPWASRWLAKAWRSACGETRTGSIPAARASVFSSCARRCRVEMPARAAGGEEPAGGHTLGHVTIAHREIGLERAAGRCAERDQAFLVALASHQQRPCLGRNRVER